MHTCSECRKRLKPIFKPVESERDNWIYLTCDTCLEEFCTDCCTQDPDGTVECHTCYQTKVIKRNATE